MFGVVEQTVLSFINPLPFFRKNNFKDWKMAKYYETN